MSRKFLNTREQNLSLGGDVGLMGQIARTVAKGLGEDSVMGVIPQALVPREAIPNILQLLSNFYY